jgi:predicted metal-binding protein
LTGCFKCLREGVQGFAGYDEPCTLVGVMTCRCPGDNITAAAKILKNKGAEVVHLATCMEAGKIEGVWVRGKGYCDTPMELAGRVAEEAGVACVLGSAHLPEGYEPARFGV